MARDRRSKSAAADRRRPQKKKVSILNTESIDWIDYKDVNLLRRFMSERAKIRARRVTGNDAKQQREVARAIRVAREMALLPYSVRQVTHRNKGKRDRDRDDRPLRAQDTSAPRPPEGSAPPPDGSSAPPADLDLDLDTTADVDAPATDVASDVDVDIEVDAGTEVEESTS
jgi:small subunit ribosomal protein S18